MGKMGKLMSIFVTPRIMRQQIIHRLDSEPAQCEKFWARNPIEFFKQFPISIITPVPLPG